MAKEIAKPNEANVDDSTSLASLFLAASRELAKSDARIYRSVDQHLRRTRAILDKEEVRQGLQEREQKGHREKSNGIAHRFLEGEPSYARQPRSCLQSLCREHGIRGYSRMNKLQLIAALRDQGVAAPPLPLQAFSKAELIALIEQLTNSR